MKKNSHRFPFFGCPSVEISSDWSVWSYVTLAVARGSQTSEGAGGVVPGPLVDLTATLTWSSTQLLQQGAGLDLESACLNPVQYFPSGHVVLTHRFLSLIAPLYFFFVHIFQRRSLPVAVCAVLAGFKLDKWTWWEAPWCADSSLCCLYKALCFFLWDLTGDRKCCSVGLVTRTWRDFSTKTWSFNVAPATQTGSFKLRPIRGSDQCFVWKDFHMFLPEGSLGFEGLVRRLSSS